MPSPSNKKTYAEKAACASLAREQANREVQKTLKYFKKNNPAFSDLTFITSVQAFPKSPKGFSKVFPKIVEFMLIDENYKLTQKSIVEAVNEKFSDFVIPSNIFNRDLQIYHRNAIEKVLFKMLDNPFELDACKTLSDIRKRLRTKNEVLKGSLNFKGKILITRDTVMVGDKFFSITQKGSGEHSYKVIRVDVRDKRQAVRVDALARILLPIRA